MPEAQGAGGAGLGRVLAVWPRAGPLSQGSRVPKAEASLSPLANFKGPRLLSQLYLLQGQIKSNSTQLRAVLTGALCFSRDQSPAPCRGVSVPP